MSCGVRATMDWCSKAQLRCVSSAACTCMWRYRHLAPQIENCNQTHSCCDGYDTSKGYFGRGADTCTLACAAVARMRPPYLNNVGQRDSQTYPIPTPDPAPGMGDSQPAGAGSEATTHGSSGTLPAPPTTYPNGMFIGVSTRAALPSSAC